MELLSSNWFYLVVGGILMITISALLFGGFIHALVQASGSWAYLTFLAFSGFSSMITGILMMFDALNDKVRHEVEETIRTKEGKYDEDAEKQLAKEEKEHIEFLVKKSESLRPEKLKKRGSSSS